MKEKVIVLACKKIVQELGGKFVKLHGSPYAEYMPDSLILFRDMPAIFVEFKVPSKVPTPAQNAKMQELENYGAVCSWHDSPDTFRLWITRIIKLKKQCLHNHIHDI